MIIPIPALWSRQSPNDPNDRIDQVLYNRTHRLMAGLSIDSKFQSVTGTLIVTVGHGKFIRLRHALDVSAPIPNSISEPCRGFADGSLTVLSQLAPLLSDLADVQAAVVDQVKCQAGKYVDRVMAVSVLDAGLWTRDFDQRLSYTSFCDATRLAEVSGVSVIDSFPARDLAVGGGGESLDAIPLWILAADRNGRVADRHRIILLSNDRPVLYFLPASDGLDAELPNIKRIELDSAVSAKQLIESVRNQIRALLDDSQLPINEEARNYESELLVVSATDEASLIQQLRQRLGSTTVESVSTLGFSASTLPAIVAALLGLMHIDQMPANIPWLTGANSQRILGRLTPGRPSNWRQLVRAMADYQPAAMKLKDAM